MIRKRFTRQSFLLIIILTVIVFASYIVISTQKPNKKTLKSPPSITVIFEPCDVDRDGDCDERDIKLLINTVGQCEDGDNYNELADADHDGCVTERDLKLLFPTASEK